MSRTSQNMNTKMYVGNLPFETTETEVRVVVGLQALCRAVAEIPRLPEAARTPAVQTSYDEITQVVTDNPEATTRRGRGTTWRMTDRSGTGARLIAPSTTVATW